MIKLDKITIGWFAYTLGTPTLAVGLFSIGLKTLSYTLISIAILAFIFLGLSIIYRITFKKCDLLEGMRDISLAPTYSTFPMTIISLGNAIISTNFLANYSYNVALFMFILANSLMYSYWFIFMYYMINKDVHPENINGSWFIPNAGNIFLPILGFKVLSFINNPYKFNEFLFWNINIYGFGTLLYFIFVIFFLYRLIFHGLPARGVLPQLLIFSAPIGLMMGADHAMRITLLNHMNFSNYFIIPYDFLIYISYFIDMIIFLVGFNWIVLMFLMKAKHFDWTHELNPTWFAFVFPLATFFLSTYLFGADMGMNYMIIIGKAGVIFTLGLWIYVSIKALGVLFDIELINNSRKAL